MTKMNFNNDEKMFAGIIGIIVFLVLLFSCTRMVPVGHVGIVTSFGRITGTSLEPGLHFTMPWHVVKRIDNRVKNTETETACFSQDLQLIDVDLNLMTVLPKDKAAQVYATVGVDYLEQVKPRIYEILKQEIAKYTAEKVIENREQIHNDVLQASRTRLSELVEIQDLVLTDINFSDAYEKAIEQKQVAQQKSLQAKYELEKAKIEAEKEIATAQGEAESLRIKGEALKENASMTLLEAIRKWDGRIPETLLIGSDIATVFTL